MTAQWHYKPCSIVDSLQVTRQSPRHKRVFSAGALSGAALDQIPGLHLHVLLNFLCNEVLNSEQMRDALQERLDESSDVKREMKGAVAEKKGELKVPPLLPLPLHQYSLPSPLPHIDKT